MPRILPQVAPTDPKKRSPQSRALEHFDDFYNSVFGERWPGIRAALLSEHKYAVIVNNFGDPEATKESIEYNGAVNLRDVFEVFKAEQPYVRDTSGDNASTIEQRLDAHLATTQSEEIRSIYQKSAEAELEKMELEKSLEPPRTIDVETVVDYKKSLQQSLAEDAEYDFDRMISAEIGVLGLQEFIPATKLKGMGGFVLESDHYRYYNTNVDFPLEFEVETSFEYPKTLDIYMHPKSDISRYLRPKRTSAGVASHFFLDGASVLPPLMLNVSPNDVVLDACSAPGGKSLILLQTMLPERIVCNDTRLSRFNLINAFYKKILPDFETNWAGNRVLVECSDILHRTEYSSYDKVSISIHFRSLHTPLAYISMGKRIFRMYFIHFLVHYMVQIPFLGRRLWSMCRARLIVHR